MATVDDVKAQQAFVSSESVNVAAGVESCRDQLPQSSIDDWYALAAQCLRFISKEPVLGMVDAMAAEGAPLVSQLQAWRAELEALGCKVPTTNWGAAPHVIPPPGPGLGSHFGSWLAGDVAPLVLLGLWAWSRVSRGR